MGYPSGHLPLGHLPSPTLRHAIAMKANPLAACLVIARDLGMGCEVRTRGALTPPTRGLCCRLAERPVLWSRTGGPRQMRSLHSPCPLSFCARTWPHSTELCH